MKHTPTHTRPRAYTLLYIYSMLLCACLHPQPACAQNSSGFDVTRNLDVMADIYRQLDMYYVDTLAADTVLRWAIDGMLSEVDPYTEFIPADEQDEFRELASGRYAGIGAAIRTRKADSLTVVTEPYEGCPAQKAGVRAGDVILSIDGKSIKGWPVNKVSEALRGEAGTTFELSIRRPGAKKPTALKIVRENIQLPAVPWFGLVDEQKRIGYMYLSSVTDHCAREVRYALNELKAQGMRTLIFDLRENTGGAVSQAVEIVGMFVPKGSLVVSTKGKVPATCFEYQTPTEPIDTLMPIHVIVDGITASAAEIISGALQDLDRATIWGQRTYGKGLVQAIRDVPYRGQLKITTARYYIPSGRCIQAYDYRHRTIDGAATALPDSLTREFRTRLGRPVRDGGGILPDSILAIDSIPTMVSDLFYSDALFDYVTAYTLQHPAIDKPGRFSLTDADYEAFADSIAHTDFKYNGRSAIVLEQLRQMTRIEGYTDAETTAAIQQLKQRLRQGDVRADLMRHRRHVQPYLEEEIVSRYYYQSGALQHQVARDKDVRRIIQQVTN